MGKLGFRNNSDISSYTAGKWQHGCKSMSTGLQSPCNGQCAPIWFKHSLTAHCVSLTGDTTMNMVPSCPKETLRPLTFLLSHRVRRALAGCYATERSEVTSKVRSEEWIKYAGKGEHRSRVFYLEESPVPRIKRRNIMVTCNLNLKKSFLNRNNPFLLNWPECELWH